MNQFTSEIKIGITAIISVIIIYTGTIFLKGLSLFDNKTSYYIEMDDVAGLAASGEVLANGLNIGFIKNITYNEDKQNLTVEVQIDPKFKVPKGTTAFVTSPMLGAPKINLKLGENRNGFLDSGDIIFGSSGSDFMSSVAELIPEIKAMLPKLDSIMTNLNDLTGSPALETSLNNIEYITANLKVSTDKLNYVLGKDIPNLMSNANIMFENADTLLRNVNSIDLSGIADNANKTLCNAKLITDNLNSALQSKDNSLGLLLNDNTIAIHLDSTVINASMLLEDLRQHPNRYVHFSLFGRKQK